MGNDNETTPGLRRRNSAEHRCTPAAHGNRNELLALEQAIVDRELIELDTRELCDEERELAREIALGSHMCRQPRATRERVMRRICGGQTDEPNRA